LFPTLLITGETIMFIVAKGIVYVVSSIVLMGLVKPLEERDKQFVKSANESLYRLIKFF